jgi:hypothetical protein
MEAYWCRRSRDVSAFMDSERATWRKWCSPDRDNYPNWPSALITRNVPSWPDLPLTLINEASILFPVLISPGARPWRFASPNEKVYSLYFYPSILCIISVFYMYFHLLWEWRARIKLYRVSSPPAVKNRYPGGGMWKDADGWISDNLHD